MKFEKTEVWGFEHALRGLRNPLESWDKSDSEFDITLYSDSDHDYKRFEVRIGDNDKKLAQRLAIAGSEHRKFLRQIFVSVDITAPLYWWSQFDTYKIGTTANSTSKMHKLATTPITEECFETGDYHGELETSYALVVDEIFEPLIDDLEQLRRHHLTYLNKSKEESLTEAEKKHCQRIAKMYWKELVRLLPESWLQKRTVTMSYENIFNMVKQRKNHKLNEWSGCDNPDLPNFIAWASGLPYADELIFIDSFKDKE